MRALSSALSVPERAMKAEPAYVNPCALVRANNAGSFRLTVTGSTDDEERTFSEAFRFEPRLAASTSVL